jgi:hypothetical protein
MSTLLQHRHHKEKSLFPSRLYSSWSCTLAPPFIHLSHLDTILCDKTQLSPNFVDMYVLKHLETVHTSDHTFQFRTQLLTEKSKTAQTETQSLYEKLSNQNNSNSRGLNELNFFTTKDLDLLKEKYQEELSKKLTKTHNLYQQELHSLFSRLNTQVDKNSALSADHNNLLKEISYLKANYNNLLKKVSSLKVDYDGLFTENQQLKQKLSSNNKFISDNTNIIQNIPTHALTSKRYNKNTQQTTPNRKVSHYTHSSSLITGLERKHNNDTELKSVQCGNTNMKVFEPRNNFDRQFQIVDSNNKKTQNKDMRKLPSNHRVINKDILNGQQKILNENGLKHLEGKSKCENGLEDLDNQKSVQLELQTFKSKYENCLKEIETLKSKYKNCLKDVKNQKCVQLELQTVKSKYENCLKDLEYQKGIQLELQTVKSKYENCLKDVENQNCVQLELQTVKSKYENCLKDLEYQKGIQLELQTVKSKYENCLKDLEYQKGIQLELQTVKSKYENCLNEIETLKSKYGTCLEDRTAQKSSQSEIQTLKLKYENYLEDMEDPKSTQLESQTVESKYENCLKEQEDQKSSQSEIQTLKLKYVNSLKDLEDQKSAQLESKYDNCLKERENQKSSQSEMQTLKLKYKNYLKDLEDQKSEQLESQTVESKYENCLKEQEDQKSSQSEMQTLKLKFENCLKELKDQKSSQSEMQTLKLKFENCLKELKDQKSSQSEMQTLKLKFENCLKELESQKCLQDLKLEPLLQENANLKSINDELNLENCALEIDNSDYKTHLQKIQNESFKRVPPHLELEKSSFDENISSPLRCDKLVIDDSFLYNENCEKTHQMTLMQNEILQLKFKLDQVESDNTNLKILLREKTLTINKEMTHVGICNDNLVQANSLQTEKTALKLQCDQASEPSPDSKLQCDQVSEPSPDSKLQCDQVSEPSPDSNLEVCSVSISDDLEINTQNQLNNITTANFKLKQSIDALEKNLLETTDKNSQLIIKNNKLVSYLEELSVLADDILLKVNYDANQDDSENNVKNFINKLCDYYNVCHDTQNSKSQSDLTDSECSSDTDILSENSYPKSRLPDCLTIQNWKLNLPPDEVTLMCQVCEFLDSHTAIDENSFISKAQLLEVFKKTRNIGVHSLKFYVAMYRYIKDIDLERFITEEYEKSGPIYKGLKLK